MFTNPAQELLEIASRIQGLSVEDLRERCQSMDLQDVRIMTLAMKFKAQGENYTRQAVQECWSLEKIQQDLGNWSD